MITLYTAVGLVKLQSASGHSYPVVVNNQQEHALDQMELLIWSSLAFQFSTFPEVKQVYEQQLLMRKLTPCYSFEHYIRRLLFRGLIAKGDGLASTDALYNLLESLYIIPLTDSFHIRLFSSLHLMLQGKLTASQFQQSLKLSPVRCPVEKLIINYCKVSALSTAQLLHCFDSNQTEEPAQPTKHPVLTALGNLYLQRRVLFNTL
jgi:hypothetical protein